jgi:mono/diheme cytochrome c family protein
MSHRSLPILLVVCLLLAACGQGDEPVSVATSTLTPQLAEGKRLFSQHCASCHAIEPEVVIVGPSLFDVSRRAIDRMPELTAQQYVELSILQPDALLVPGFDNLMPSNFGKNLNGQELDAIVAYVLSLQ